MKSNFDWTLIEGIKFIFLTSSVFSGCTLLQNSWRETEDIDHAVALSLSEDDLKGKSTAGEINGYLCSALYVNINEHESMIISLGKLKVTC